MLISYDRLVILYDLNIILMHLKLYLYKLIPAESTVTFLVQNYVQGYLTYILALAILMTINLHVGEREEGGIDFAGGVECHFQNRDKRTRSRLLSVMTVCHVSYTCFYDQCWLSEARIDG